MSLKQIADKLRACGLSEHQINEVIEMVRQFSISAMRRYGCDPFLVEAYRPLFDGSLRRK